MSRRLTVGAPLVVAVLGLAACGGTEPAPVGGGSADLSSPRSAPATADDTADDTAGSSTGQVVDDPAPAATLDPDFCAGLVSLGASTIGSESPAGPLAALDSMRVGAPEGLGSSIDVLSAAFGVPGAEVAAIVTGAGSLERTDVRLAWASVHEPGHRGCGFSQVEVVGSEVGLSGPADPVRTGHASVRFVNTSTERTLELVVRRVADGAAVGATTIEPGGANLVVLDLQPGEHVAELVELGEQGGGATSFPTAAFTAVP